MASRLGMVLYWLGCGVAAILAVVAGYMAIEFPWNDKVLAGAALALALASWLTGRALRYILAGT